MLLSICIPSYNRFGNLSRIIESIKQCKSQDFEVVIVDNCSSGDVGELVPKDDGRFRLIKREKSVKGPLNCRQSFESGIGEYCMMLLDKDFLDGNALASFLTMLKSFDNVACGYCDLNYMNQDTKTVITHPSNSIREMYIMRHPSGMFVKSKYIQEDKIKTDACDVDSVNWAEFVFARALLNGDMLRFKSPMVYTETEDEAAKTPSYSYCKDDAWFAPKQKLYSFDRFCRHVNTLDLSDKQKTMIAKHLYINLISASTFGYRETMKNEKICAHHMMNTSDITVKEMDDIKKHIENHFKKNCSLPLSFVSKSWILIHGTIYYRAHRSKLILKTKGRC